MNQCLCQQQIATLVSNSCRCLAVGGAWPVAINFSVVAQDLRADGSEASDSKGEWISSVTMDFDRRGVGQVVAARGALGVDGILAIKTCS